MDKSPGSQCAKGAFAADRKLFSRDRKVKLSTKSLTEWACGDRSIEFLEGATEVFFRQQTLIVNRWCRAMRERKKRGLPCPELWNKE